MFTDEETLPWVKNKIAVTTTLKAETNSELYGAMHILCSEWQGMERYTKAYKCDQKQGLIANLAGDLGRAIDRLEALGQECSEMRATLAKTDEILGCRWAAESST
jgi:hypothetical protein